MHYYGQKKSSVIGFEKVGRRREEGKGEGEGGNKEGGKERGRDCSFLMSGELNKKQGIKVLEDSGTGVLQKLECHPLVSAHLQMMNCPCFSVQDSCVIKKSILFYLKYTIRLSC